MILFKCKICGGNLEVDGNTNIASCQYCGSTMTIPRLDDEQRINLYDRAGHFRRGGEFDKAISIYERILEEDKTDAEAYWSLVLCKYGIEYVEDPATKQYTPTCNRAQLTSIFADEDYKAAIQYASESAKAIYQADAAVIDNVVKGIVEISLHEKPFDIFICYKESDANGRRTPDSVLAQELYHNLIKEGFHVFFSRITLESKLGTEYEPYIFAALNSAPVMVAIGTKPEYFQAPWVKNEWSRYLSSIKSGAQKTLIPAYRDMDPYDLPEDFSHLQAQDMGKLGFMQDLIHGIKKLTGAKQAFSPMQAVSEPANVDSLLERAYLNLEYAEWQKADDALERYLDHHPKSAKAHVGKLMRELRISHESELAEQDSAFDQKVHYQKAVRFADDAYREVLEGYANAVRKRVELKASEYKYNEARSKKYLANTPAKYRIAANAFRAVSGYKDADEQMEACLAYAKGLDEKKKARAEQERLEAERKKQKTKKVAMIAVPIFIVAFILIFVISAISGRNAEKKFASQLQQKYDIAVSNFEAEHYLDAIGQFRELDGYLDSNDRILEAGYLFAQAADYQTNSDYQLVIGILGELGNYKDAQSKRTELMYDFAQFLLKNNHPQLALGYLGRVLDYKDARELHHKLSKKLHSVSITSDFALFLTESGDVLKNRLSFYSFTDNIAKLDDWDDMIQVHALYSRAVGLKADGTVLMDDNFDRIYYKALQEANNIVTVSISSFAAAGLKQDGSIVVTGYKHPEFNAEEFTDLVAISLTDSEIMGIKADGTVVASFDIKGDLTDIVSIDAGSSRFVGLTSGAEAQIIQDSGSVKRYDGNDIVMAKAQRSTYIFLLDKQGTVSSLDTVVDYDNLPKASNIFYLSFDVIGIDLDGNLFTKEDNLADSIYAEKIPYWDYVNPEKNNLTSA